MKVVLIVVVDGERFRSSIVTCVEALRSFHHTPLKQNKVSSSKFGFSVVQFWVVEL